MTLFYMLFGFFTVKNNIIQMNVNVRTCNKMPRKGKQAGWIVNCIDHECRMQEPCRGSGGILPQEFFKFGG